MSAELLGKWSARKPGISFVQFAEFYCNPLILSDLLFEWKTAACDRKMVKPANPANKSRKFAEYVPFWA